MHIMELRTDEKILLITMIGLMSEKESVEYIDELKTLIKCINPIKYNIVIDAGRLESYPSNYNSFIEQSMELITNAPFKKRYGIMPENIIAKTQVKRVTNKDNAMCDTIIVESYDEVLDSIA